MTAWNFTLISMEDFSDIKFAQISDLLKRFSGNSYSSKVLEDKDEKIIDICIALWKLDYRCEIVENKNGSLCSTYPSRIVVPVYEIGVGGVGLHSSPLSDSVLIETCADNLEKTCIKGTPSNTTQKGRSNESPSSKNSSNHLTNSTNFTSQDTNETNSNVDEEHLLDKAFSYDNCRENSPATPTFSSVVAKSSKKSNGRTYSQGAPSSSPHKFTLRECFHKANLARCRYRFPVPAILCKGKYISRSATLSCFIDVIGKQILHSSDALAEAEDDCSPMPKHSNDLDRARFHDINLLEAIGTSSILDLMVENKKVKYSINVSSSEKADKENRYSKFSIASIPYPGCEFFREFTSQKFCSSKLFYDWDQPFNDATLSLAEETISAKVTSDWKNYKSWDLRKITENYLKLILRYILDDESKETGFLLHCISGWDRTPLFISLIRLSLWADGLVHCSLDAKQMLFFTLAYDWYLFGHQLPDRLKSKENILYFCFEFLDEIYMDSFMDSVDIRERHPSNGSCTSGAYDSANGGIETPLSSFGSATSLASSSSSNNLPPPPPPSASSAPYAPKGNSTSKQNQKEETCSWPFNKENGFSFDGISENESARNRSTPGEGATAPLTKRASPSRSPLKERNKGSTKHSPGGIKSGGRKGNLNGFLRDFSCRRSQKNSNTETPSFRFSSGSESLEVNFQDGSGVEGDAPSGVSGAPSKGASNPVPVPGVRSRHNSASSSVGSWQFLSTSDPLKESFSVSFDSHKSSRTSLTADMVDSTHTIKEEVTPSSSLESSQSIIVFNRKRRLSEVREMFFKVYTREVSSMYPEWSFLTDIVHNLYQKLGN